VGHGRIYKGSQPDIIEIDRFFKLNVLIENVGSPSPTNVILRCIVIMC